MSARTKFYVDKQEGKWLGVCAGIADYTGFDITLVRVAMIVLTLAMLVLGHDPGLFGALSGFDLFVGSVGAILTALFVIQTSATVRRLGVLEPVLRAGLVRDEPVRK